MTREEAYELQTHRLSKGSVLRYRSYIDKIYDDFESRTCESCKYGARYTAIHTMYICHNPHEMLHGKVFDKFGCNKWEAKNDSL